MLTIEFDACWDTQPLQMVAHAAMEKYGCSQLHVNTDMYQFGKPK